MDTASSPRMSSSAKYGGAVSQAPLFVSFVGCLESRKPYDAATGPPALYAVAET